MKQKYNSFAVHLLVATLQIAEKAKFS